MFDNDKTLVNMLVKFTEPMQVIIERCAVAVLLENKTTIYNPVFSITLNGKPEVLHGLKISKSSSEYNIHGVIHLQFGDFVLSTSPSNEETQVVGQFVD